MSEKGEQQLDVLFGQRLDRVLRWRNTHCDEQFPAALCGTATAVPRMFARTAP